MANTFFKSLTESDRTSSRTLLHEAIPITGTLVSGTYLATSTTVNNTLIERGVNIKTFSHGMFQSVYDYPYASSSANHIFDITFGIAPYVPAGNGSGGFQGNYTAANQLYNKVVSGSGESLAKKKRAIYNQMAQVLVGYDTSGSIRLFDRDGNFSTASDKILDPTFINFSRLLTKDEIKKGSFSFDLGVHLSSSTPFLKVINIADTGADSNYKVNSPAGEYGILKVTNKVGLPLDDTAITNSGSACGLIYYQAGIAVLDSSMLFRTIHQPNLSIVKEMGDQDGLLSISGSGLPTAYTGINFSGSLGESTSGLNYDNYALTGSIDEMADNIRRRILNVSFNNTTELNSTIYFCRANHNEFNYSSNVTYLSGSQIRVKASEVLNPPKSFATTVGLYSADNELLAVAKLSEPLRKDPTNELTLRVRLDY
tara:strand:+ start:1083 stop:2360 length:1278 start_codon:yes stop_codon:yes gene_type:complete